MPVAARSLAGARLIALALAVLSLTSGSRGEAMGRQTAVQPAPCLGYAYNIQSARLVAGGVQIVAEVLPETPAQAGGLRPGDVLVSVAGVSTGSGAQAPRLVPGDTIPMVVSREGRNVTLTMVVGQRQPVPGGDPVCRPVPRLPAGR